MRTLEVIDTEIADLKRRLAETTGTETEVYTRIVGYYRSLRNWNKGKREEYSFRRPFEASTEAGRKPKAATAEKIEEAEAVQKDAQGTLFDSGVADRIATYNYFYRKTCPNCPPVQNYVDRLPIEGSHVDVDTEEGMSRAVNCQVLSTPTVVFFDREGRPVYQSHSVGQLESLFADLG